MLLEEDYSKEALVAALQAADLYEEVQALPEGMATFIGENGRSLSGGQKQRLALARGLLRGRKIILMDEGTANLDKLSAVKIEETLISHPELTVIMSTHHLRKCIKSHLDAVIDVTVL